MPGNNRSQIVRQIRDERLLAFLSVMGGADRDQLKAVGGFRSNTRINARLLRMVRAGWLRKLKVTLAGRPALYTITRQGFALASLREALDPESYRPLSSVAFLEHQLEINRIYLAVRHQTLPPEASFRIWQTFRRRISLAVPLVPDGYFELAHGSKVLPMFLEVDRGTEGLREWKTKTERYLKLAVSGEFQEHFQQQQFRVLVIANSETRVNAIRRTVLASTDKIFWFATFSDINRDGLWSPSGSVPETLKGCRSWERYENL